MVPRELSTVAPLRVTITVPALRVSIKVSPPRVIETRVPVISQEENIGGIIQIDMVESEKMQ